MVETVLRDIADAIGVGIVRATGVQGGDVATAFRLELEDGRRVFAKTSAAVPPQHFTTEAAGLAWIRGASDLCVPQLVAVSDTPPFLVLEWVEEEGAVAETEASLGRGLAALHHAGAASFGRSDRRPTGSRGLPNEPCATWAEFYATQRLLPLIRLARDSQALPDRTLRGLETIAGQLVELGGDPEPPARLHGDLWAGNRLVGRGGRNWLIDPAAHGGHREFDLAMMRLFGGFGPDVFAAYAETHPLVAEWQDRVALHQLAPLVIHAVKFGGSYPASVERALSGYV
ncbi:MAG: fructosamine kinase family protein [Vicinamibacterales bacterium]|nr:fructosamine kinase family protein [Vicinamibacterales bacterium]